MAPAAGLSSAQARASVEELWELLNQYYYDSSSLGRAEWKSARERYSAEAAAHPERVGSLRQATLQALRGDRYTRLLDAAQYEAISRYDVLGVGLILAPGSDGLARVISPPIPGSSAIGQVKVDDSIVSIDGVSTAGMSSFDMLDLVSAAGDADTLRFVVKRGEEQRTIDLKRSTVADPIGRVATSGNVAYVRLREFNARLAPRLKEVVTTLADRGASRFILDLRANPGGAFQSAVAAASIFLPPNSPVVDVVSRDGHQVFAAKQADERIPFESVELWLDRKSASSSEIFAAALRDNCAAVLAADQNSFGKGLIQAVFGFKDNSGGLVVSVAEYRTPNGDAINGHGVKPDIPLPPRTVPLLGPRAIPDARQLDSRFHDVLLDSMHMCKPPAPLRNPPLREFDSNA